jgi:hypothetical protein
MDDDAAMMAELLAISNKSASSRFDDFDDNQKDPDPSPKPSPQATPRRKSSSNAMAKGRLASAQKAKDIMESMKKVIRSDESYFEETRVVDDNIWIVSQTRLIRQDPIGRGLPGDMRRVAPGITVSARLLQNLRLVVTKMMVN